jgi:uncharacterized membrane protein YgcG
MNTNESEQAYLTTNKSIYTAGETIWFRAFLLHSISNTVSTRSKTLFVDVVDGDEKRITTALLNAGEQQTSGNLSLPDSLRSGPYWIRAYTRTMAISDTEKAAVVPIYFYNPRVPDTLYSDEGITANEAPTLHFYAEGGTMVTGAPSAIVLHVTDKEGRPVQMNGYLKDSHDSVITEFYTNTYGLSKITFIPSRYRKYRAEIMWKNKMIRYELPPFNFYAGQLSVSRNPYGALAVRTMLEDSIYNKEAVTYLLGISRGHVYFAGVGHGRYQTEVAEKKFPRGIATFLLYDAGGKLLSERSVYVRTGNLDFRMGLDKPSYFKRDKVNLNATVWDASVHTLSSSLAISVADNKAVNFEQGNNYQLINSILDGRADNWALAHLNSLSEEEMDLVMLGVTDHFNKIYSSRPMKVAEEMDSLLYVRGFVSSPNEKPVPNKLVTLLSTAPMSLFLTDTTNALGHFCFPLENYPDSTQFALQVGRATTWDKSLKLVVDSLRFPAFHTPLALKKPLSVGFPELQTHFFHFADTSDHLKKNGLLKEVVIKASKPLYLKQRASFTSTIITSDALIERGRVTLGDAFLGRTDVKLLSSSRYPILIIDGNVFPFDGVKPPKPGGGGGGGSAGRGKPGSGGGSAGGGGEEIETVDFSPVYYFLNTLVIKDIDFIEILSPMVALEYGPRGRYGGIYIHTKAADGIYENGGLHLFYAKGYCKDVAFPLVNYDHKDARSEKAMDKRSTLFWIGNVLNNAGGYYNGEFYTNDIPGTYTVTVSGITVHGDIIFDSTDFEVK